MIKFKNVSKRYGEVAALDKASFKISSGEFLFITGPSGSGKTTIIRLILREIFPSSGKIEVDGIDLSQLPTKKVPDLRRKIGVVFQDFKLLPDQTVFENVALALKVLGKDEAEIEKEVGNVLKLVDLADRADFFPAQLAGGELQRTCLARAVVSKPKIVLADEPTGNLDIASGWQITKLLREINKLGKTVVIATHNFEIVDSLKARVIELDKGKVISDKEKGKYKVK
ncbi:MAG TPA: cell division ATP-binding protein FtsE [Candidatus Bathyarchaeia archaeon]|nr:cell division ATP-binding protein FtsE [Candidatus Bathyarchaeia archaeon]